jgi:hypothetical protein
MIGFVPPLRGEDGFGGAVPGVRCASPGLFSFPPYGRNDRGDMRGTMAALREEMQRSPE